MRTGKISENVLRRSVLKRCKAKQEDMVQGPGVGRDCAIFHIEGKTKLAASLQPVVADEPEKIRYAICHVANNLACAGTRGTGILLSLLLPVETREETLRKMMDMADSCCQSLGLALAGGHTEVVSGITYPLVTVSALGLSEEKEGGLGIPVPGLDLVMTGFAAMEGTAILARREEKRLLEKFPLDLVEQARCFDEQLWAGREAEIAWSHGAVSIHDISQGGVFGALWEMGEKGGIGLEAELKKIPLKQETVEICELLGLNPYCLESGGALLIAAGDGKNLVRTFLQAGIPAVLLGRTTDSKDKVLLNGQERRFLEKPAQDEILKQIGNQ